MSQYPSLDNQTGQGYNNNAAGYGNPNPYNQPPYNQGQNYGPPPAYNDNYEIYNQGYSGRQKCIIIAAVIFFGVLVGGFIMFVSRRMSANRYAYY